METAPANGAALITAAATLTVLGRVAEARCMSRIHAAGGAAAAAIGDGDEGGGGVGGGFRSLVYLGEDELAASFDERREGTLQRKDGLQVFIFRVQTLQHGEDKLLVSDRVAELGARICHGLEASAVVVGAEVALDEVVELGRKIHGALFLMAEKLNLETEPHLARGDVGLHDGFEEVSRDGAVEPCEHHTIHPCPGRMFREGGVGEDVVGERVLAERDKEQAAPLGVVGSADVEDDGNEGLDVQNGHRLGVEGVDGVGGERRAPGRGADGLFVVC